MKVIDQAVNDSLDELKRNPHDEISEQMLNEALNDKLALLKDSLVCDLLYFHPENLILIRKPPH